MNQKLYITVALIIGIVLALNLLGNEYHMRLDLTEDGQYTLSAATRDILESLEDPVTVKAYFSDNVPPAVAKTRRDFQDMLVEYEDLADGMLVYEFVNPNESDIYAQEAMQQGVQPVMINVREKDQMKQQRAFLGAIVSLGDKREAIPVIQPGAAMEYALSTAVKKIAIADKPVVGFIQGHGEPGLAEMGQLNQQLDVLYKTEAVTLTDSTSIPENIKTLALIRPMDSIPASHLAQMGDFLSKGGRMLVAINRVTIDMRQQFGSSLNTGLETWLAQQGIQVDDNFVIDAQCGAVQVPKQMGFITLPVNISFPYIPVISHFANHPVTSGLEGVMLEFASTVRYTGDTLTRFTPLAFTSELSDSVAAPQYFDMDKEWTEEDFKHSGLPVAAALEGNLAGNSPAKMVVIADGDLIVNGGGQQPRELQPDNVNLVSNSIDWLSDDTGLIALRTKGVTSRPIRELEGSTKTVLKYVNFLLPLLLAIGYGIFRSQNNRIKRMKRMNENYEAAQ